MPVKFTTLLDAYLDAKAALDEKKRLNPESGYYDPCTAAYFYEREQEAFDAAEKALNDLVNTLIDGAAKARLQATVHPINTGGY